MIIYNDIDAVKRFLRIRHYFLVNAGRLDLAAKYFKFLRGETLLLDLKEADHRELYEYLNACSIPSRPIWHTMRIFKMETIINSNYRVFEPRPFNA